MKIDTVYASDLKNQAVKTKVLNGISSVFKIEESTDACDCKNIIEQIKQAYQTEKNSAQKLKLLTTLPSTWSANRIKTEFNSTWRFAKKAKALQSERGFLADPEIRASTKRLSQETVKIVRRFYLSPSISRTMPGTRDTVSFYENGVKVVKQKQLMLLNLRETYVLFKQEHGDLKVGASSFYNLRPKECVLIGTKGTHVTCVCVYHQNVKLMHEVLLKLDLLMSHKDLMKKLMCQEATTKCKLLECKNCPPQDNLQEFILQLFEEKNISQVTYKNWVSTDRTNLIFITEKVEDFAMKYTDKLNDLIKHDFVAKTQAEKFEAQKKNLKPGEVIVHWDFAENFTHSLQDSVSSEYFNATQTTVHPCVVYYLDKNSEPVHKSFAFLSPCLDHGSQFVRAVQKKLILELKILVPNLTKVIYWSDGCAAQYKNKYMFYWLAHHFSYYKLKAEYNFFATAHGKGAVDGVGATVKRLLRLESLKPSKDTIINTSKAAYEFLKNKNTNIKVYYLTEGDITKIILPKYAITVIGTRQFHTVQMESQNPPKLLFMKVYNDTESLLIHYRK